MRACCTLPTIGLLVSLLPACAVGPPPEEAGPAEIYLAWHEAIAGGDWERAVRYLDPEAVSAFRDLGQRLAESVGSRSEPLDFFLRGVRTEVAAPLRSVTVVQQDGAGAIVRVLVGECDAGADAGSCLSREVRVVFRQGRYWIKPELPGGLRAGAARGEEVKP